MEVRSRVGRSWPAVGAAGTFVAVVVALEVIAFVVLAIAVPPPHTSHSAPPEPSAVATAPVPHRVP